MSLSKFQHLPLEVQPSSKIKYRKEHVTCNGFVKLHSAALLCNCYGLFRNEPCSQRYRHPHRINRGCIVCIPSCGGLPVMSDSKVSLTFPCGIVLKSSAEHIAEIFKCWVYTQENFRACVSNSGYRLRITQKITKASKKAKRRHLRALLRRISELENLNAAILSRNQITADDAMLGTSSERDFAANNAILDASNERSFAVGNALLDASNERNIIADDAIMNASHVYGIAADITTLEIPNERGMTEDDMMLDASNERSFTADNAMLDTSNERVIPVDNMLFDTQRESGLFPINLVYDVSSSGRASSPNYLAPYTPNERSTLPNNWAIVPPTQRASATNNWESRSLDERSPIANNRMYDELNESALTAKYMHENAVAGNHTFESAFAANYWRATATEEKHHPTYAGETTEHVGIFNVPNSPANLANFWMPDAQDGTTSRSPYVVEANALCQKIWAAIRNERGEAPQGDQPQESATDVVGDEPTMQEMEQPRGNESNSESSESEYEPTNDMSVLRPRYPVGEPRSGVQFLVIWRYDHAFQITSPDGIVVHSPEAQSWSGSDLAVTHILNEGGHPGQGISWLRDDVCYISFQAYFFGESTLDVMLKGFESFSSPGKCSFETDNCTVNVLNHRYII